MLTLRISNKLVEPQTEFFHLVTRQWNDIDPTMRTFNFENFLTLVEERDRGGSIIWDVYRALTPAAELWLRMNAPAGAKFDEEPEPC